MEALGGVEGRKTVVGIKYMKEEIMNKKKYESDSLSKEDDECLHVKSYNVF